MLQRPLLTAIQVPGNLPPAQGALHYQSRIAGIIFPRPSSPMAPGTDWQGESRDRMRPRAALQGFPH